jgi:hypothetical protein
MCVRGLGGVPSSHARSTARFSATHEAIGFALGGEAGAAARVNPGADVSAGDSSGLREGRPGILPLAG